MSLNQALNAAMAGLRATQTQLSLVAANIANAGTSGYIRKTGVQIATTGGENGIGVQVVGVTRELDQYIQRQLRIETSGAAYADLLARFHAMLQSIHGKPGGETTLETAFNRLTSALQALSASPESPSVRSEVLSAAEELAQQLNRMTEDIQGLRIEAELGLASAVSQANDALREIARINAELSQTTQDNAARAALLDQRDMQIGRLAALMDIRVLVGDGDQVTIFTSNGFQLAGIQAAQLSFDARGTLDASAQWSADPTERGVGTVTLVTPNGSGVDLLASKAIRSGEIAAYVEMRDDILVKAQAQLDELAATLARALSDRTVPGVAVSAGTQAGFDVDIGGLLAGNTINLTYTDSSNVQHRITLVRVDDPSVLPLPSTYTPDPDDDVIGIDFSGGMASVVAQLNAALGSAGLQFSNPVGSVLRVLDDGSGNTSVEVFSATQTVAILTGGVVELPFFVDGNVPYTGAVTASGLQIVGFAGRIAVNPALITDPSRLVVFNTSPLTDAGDSTRPSFLSQRLAQSAIYSPRAGIGTTEAPFVGSLTSYLRQMVSQQGNAAEAASRLSEGQQVVVNALRQRFEERASVNIDREMASLLELQTAYGANARVMTALQEMMDLLLRM